eukprot:TRINITY_DN23504_c0_g3_i1.p1 TRINITY_DN23504_c0_g3~~TRINITY_DN23504_c0_g3_i1.p1  ORF type:complete len:371 (+),score=79.27 TRINITY_DN23504_c0_g3_i1:53-1114(+)
MSPAPAAAAAATAKSSETERGEPPKQRQRLWLWRLLATVVPVASLTAAVGTVVTCLCIWRSGPHFVKGLTVPAISELGVEEPERRIYQVGFALCGALLSSSLLLYRELVPKSLLGAPTTPPAKASAKLAAGSPVRVPGEAGGSGSREGMCQSFDAEKGCWSVALEAGEVQLYKPEALLRLASEADARQLQSLVWWGHVSAAGIITQGLVTLSHEGVGPQNLVHWGGAITFMLGAQLHAQASNELYGDAADRGAPLLQSAWVRLALRMREIILNYSSVAMFAVPLVMQFVPEASGSNDGNATATIEVNGAPFDPKMMNMMGLMQWGIIGQFALYFCSYTLDLQTAVALEAQGAQ